MFNLNSRSRAATLAKAFALALVFVLQAQGSEPKKEFRNPIASVCAKLLSPLEKPLQDKKPWAISAQTETKIQELWSDPHSPLSIEERLERQHDYLLDDRLTQTNAISRFFTRSAIKNSRTQRSLYSRTLGKLVGWIAGPHYHPIFNRTQHVPMAQSLGRRQDIVDLTISIHELEHAYHRNAHPFLTLASISVMPMELQFLFLPAPISPLILFRTESRAMGAQWEFVHRLPLSIREYLIAELDLRDEVAKNLENFDFGKKSGIETYEQFQRDLLEAFKTKSGSAGLKEYATVRHLYDSMRAFQKTQINVTLLRKLIEVTRKSLEYADLSKEEFLDRQAKVHGYALENLVHRHFRFGAFRKYLLTVGLINVALWYNQGAHGLPNTHLIDVDFLIHLLHSWVGG